MSLTENNDDVLVRADVPRYNTRHTEFTLNQSKLTKNLKKDAIIENYVTVVNNYQENVNIKCGSGFYLEVAGPALLSLAKQTSDNSSLIIKNIRIACTNTRMSLDNQNFHVNSTFFFNLHNIESDNLLGSVTIHCHVTTLTVQLQGSKIISGEKAPIWFFEQVLKNTFDREGNKKSNSIKDANEAIGKLACEDACISCDKKITQRDKFFICPKCNSHQHQKCTLIFFSTGLAYIF